MEDLFSKITMCALIRKRPPATARHPGGLREPESRDSESDAKVVCAGAGSSCQGSVA